MSGSILQSGPVTPGHVVMWIGNGIVRDAGPSDGGLLTQVGITNGVDEAFGINSGPITAPYTHFGIQVSPNGQIQFVFEGVDGGAAAQLSYVINGVTYNFPGPGSGDVTGPNSSVDGDIAVFNGTTGKLLRDSGGAPQFTVASIAALRALDAKLPVVTVDGYYVPGDQGGGVFAYISDDTTSPDNGGTIIVDAGGHRYYRQTPYGVNVRMFGAKGDGVTDDTVPIRAAIATGQTVLLPRPTASYLVTDAIACSTHGQIIHGDGKGDTIITVTPSFNLSATGVFVVTSGVPGPQFRDFQINFTQPDTSNRADLVAYPPAFYAQNQPRCRWERIKVNAAIIAIDIRQNSGGCSITDCELCAFTYHIAIDGSLDSIIIQNPRLENDLLTPNQSIIYYEPQTIGICVGRCDDLHVHGGLSICGQAISCIPSVLSSGNVFGEITGMDFDTNSGISMGNGGVLDCAGCTFTLGVTSAQAITISNGTINLAGGWILATVPTDNGAIVMTGAAGAAATLNMTAARVDTTGDAFALQMQIASSGACQSIITNSIFNPDPNALITKNCIQVDSGATLTFSNNRFGGRASSTGNALGIATDGDHNVTGNSFSDWAINIPSGQTINANNSPMSPGQVGEYITANANGIAMTNAVTSVIASINLSAGDWDVWGGFQAAPAGSTRISFISAAVNTAASLPANLTASGGAFASVGGQSLAGQNYIVPTGSARISINSETTVYLVAAVNFDTSTCSGNGIVNARRVR